MEKLIQIYLEFLHMSLLSFGSLIGVMPEMERIFVTKYHWIETKEFYQTYAIGQFLPGPNMAMCPVLGFKIGGIAGSIAAYLGIITGPVLLMGITYLAMEKWKGNPKLQRLDQSLRPIVFGLSLAGILKIFWIQATQSQIGTSALPLALFMIFILGVLQLRQAIPPILSLFLGAGLWFALEIAVAHH